MKTSIGIGKREQVENTLKVTRGEEGNLSCVGVVVYEDEEEGWSNRCPQIGSIYPDDTRMTLEDISKKRLAGGIVQVTLTYELRRNGDSDLGGVEEPDYDVDYSCSEEPLLTHPDFKNLSEEEQDALMAVASGASPKDTIGDDDKVIKDIVKSDAGKKALEKLRKGHISFLCPGGTFSLTSTKGSISFAGVGKKGSPPAGAPAAPSGCNWLKEGIRGRKTGSKGNWRVTETWRLSGRGGWDSDLY